MYLISYIPFLLLKRSMHADSTCLTFIEVNVNLHCSTLTKKMSFLQTLISLRLSEICQNVNLPCFNRRCPSECIFWISNFRRVLYVVCFLLGSSPASEFRRRETTQKKTYEWIFSLPGQVHSYFVQTSAIHRVRQASYSFPVSINNLSTLRWWRWKKPKLNMFQINITLTLGVKKEVYLKENDQICALNKWLTFKPRIKSHLLFAGIIRSSPFSPR